MRTEANRLGVVAIALGLAACGAPSARAIPGAASIEPIANEPPARIVVAPALAAALALGRVVIPFRAENVHVVPVFGAAALAVSPRIGHLHVQLDDAPWVWAHASDEAVIINGLPPGPHRVVLELRTANHELLDQAAVRFEVPVVPARIHAAAADAASAAAIVAEPPAAEPLSRGVALIRYRAENLQIAPVFGAAALAITPSVGHVHVTVDDATWRWADASGAPVIVAGLPPGPHQIRIDLVNAAHQPLDHVVVELVVPATRTVMAEHH
jgi:hypothetical protein